ncbi:MAG TPA: helix-turn-helix transcriptional regulator [Alphaproteobacteria bacterium]|nr:helix-turn-helix transcriptional regulator [Alphaproteobacteria bacterium]HNS44919.1 helix-turn-helix transcriptional regulator [Alphaproteobacteria bacterium]
MLTHETIWLAIDRLAQSCGYSTSGLAKKAGLDPTAFNRSKRTGPDGKPRWPSTESVARILDATGAQMVDFVALISDEKGSAVAKPKIPVIGYAQAGKEGYFDDAGYPTGEGWDHIHFPYPEQGNVKYYALEVAGDSMMPLFRSGDRLIVSPDAAIRRGDRVVVKTSAGEVMAKELLRQTAGKIELRSLNPDHENRSFETREISWIARIIWVSQ